MASCIFGLSGYLHAVGRNEMSVKFIGLSEKIYESIHFKISSSRAEEAKKFKCGIIEKIGESRFAELYNEGKEMSVKEILNILGLSADTQLTSN